jgi:hypothetical protein
VVLRALGDPTPPEAPLPDGTYPEKLYPPPAPLTDLDPSPAPALPTVYPVGELMRCLVERVGPATAAGMVVQVEVVHGTLVAPATARVLPGPGSDSLPIAVRILRTELAARFAPIVSSGQRATLLLEGLLPSDAVPSGASPEGILRAGDLLVRP